MASILLSFNIFVFYHYQHEHMMKSFLLLPLLMLTILFTSCRKEEITQEITEVVIPNRTITTDIQPNTWQRDDANGSYFVEIDMPEIDKKVYDSNGILAYFSFDGTTFEAIPDVWQGATLKVTHSIGKLYIDIQGADGVQIAPPTEAIFVKIILVDSEIVP
jgi:hypothetical protein